MSGPPLPDRVPLWRVGAGLAVLALLAVALVFLAPVYVHNLQLKSFLRETTPVSDEMLQQALLNRARAMGLDIVPDHIQIHHPAGGPAEVRYVIRVTLPVYTVDLHFSSTVGESRR